EEGHEHGQRTHLAVKRKEVQYAVLPAERNSTGLEDGWGSATRHRCFCLRPVAARQQNSRWEQYPPFGVSLPASILRALVLARLSPGGLPTGPTGACTAGRQRAVRNNHSLAPT